MRMSISESEPSPDWYSSAFDSTTTMMPWADRTEEDVERALQILEPPPGARILDLACGMGSHAIELSRRGFDVVGVDIASELIELAYAEADSEGLDVEFFPADFRELDFADEFDAVLNLHDGAIGYFEDDEENRRTFETIAKALRPGGRNLAQIPNLLFAYAHLPERTWTCGSDAIELLERHWGDDDRYVEGEMTPIVFDDPDRLKPRGFRQRLYGVDELFELYHSVGMSLRSVRDGDGTPIRPAPAEREIFVVAQKD